MTLAPSVYLDECVDYNLVDALRKRGFSVTSVFDEHTESLDDKNQLAYAANRSWVLLTHNAKHFAQLHLREQPHAGIVVIPGHPPFEQLVIRAAMTLAWLATQEYRGRLYRWGQLQQLLEQGYCPPGFHPSDVRVALGRKVN